MFEFLFALCCCCVLCVCWGVCGEGEGGGIGVGLTWEIRLVDVVSSGLVANVRHALRNSLQQWRVGGVKTSQSC